jgi:hypothetical protein
VTIRIGDQVLFLKGLANFRDLPDHFVSPIVLTAGQKLTMDVHCTAAGKLADGPSCKIALIMVGASTATRQP